MIHWGGSGRRKHDPGFLCGRYIVIFGGSDNTIFISFRKVQSEQKPACSTAEGLNYRKNREGKKMLNKIYKVMF